LKIAAVHAREVLDSRGNPTVEAEVLLDDGSAGWAIVPSGASTGRNEAHELRDGDPERWEGRGVLRAVRNVNERIAAALRGLESDVHEVDRVMIELDGTPNKSRLGANSILAVSLANARAAAEAKHMELCQFIAKLTDTERMVLPTPMVNIVSGGLHAGGNLDLQDFLVIPVGASSFREAVDWVGKVYHAVKRLLREKGQPTLAADEGGFGPRLSRNEDALKLLCDAVEMAGLALGREMALALDLAATQFYSEGRYVLRLEGLKLSGEEVVELLDDWCSRYPVVSVEDGCADSDWEGWARLTSRLGNRLQLIGDDLFATNTSLIQAGAKRNIANAVLIKPNQIGTLSETLEAIDLCRKLGYTPVVSTRSGETEDTFIADLAVGTGVGQIKIGSITRSERTAKYNRLLRLEERLGREATYAGATDFQKYR